MEGHISQIAKRRISDFFTQEDGHVGRKNALAAGTVISGAMLAAIMLAPDTAEAYSCGSPPRNCEPWQQCCSNCDWELPGMTKWYWYFCWDGPTCPPQNPGC